MLIPSVKTDQRCQKQVTWICTVGIMMQPTAVSRLSTARNFFYSSDIGILGSNVHRCWLGLPFSACVVFCRYRPYDLSIPRHRYSTKRLTDSMIC